LEKDHLPAAAAQPFLPRTELHGTGLVKEAYRLFFKHFAAILAIVLTVALPVELVKNYYFYDPFESIAAAFRRDVVVNIFFLSLITPIVILFVLAKLEGAAGFRAPFKTGFRKWPFVAGYAFLRNLIVNAGLVLLVIPGVIFFFRLLFVSTIVTIEGTRGKDPVTISNLMAKGRGFRLFLHVLPVWASGAPIIWLQYNNHIHWNSSWITAASLDLLLVLYGQIQTILVLLLYLRFRSEPAA
jgi:hypothetical protein